ncbi:hypothetical protein J6590_067972 [Homalodisca vitripennis]|nr:hypothetical protein J6590_067972 [Homalodisca vitripennis]
MTSVSSVFVRPGDGAGRALPGGTGLSGTTECPALRPGEADPVPSARQQYTAVRSAVHCLRLQRERLVTYTATETSCQTIEGYCIHHRRAKPDYQSGEINVRCRVVYFV